MPRTKNPSVTITKHLVATVIIKINLNVLLVREVFQTANDYHILTTVEQR